MAAYIDKLVRKTPHLRCTSCSMRSTCSDYDAMSLRMGMSRCMKHIGEGTRRATSATRIVCSLRMTKLVVFLDFETEMDPGRTPWQIGAMTSSGVTFSAMITLPDRQMPRKLRSHRLVAEGKLLARTTYALLAEPETVVVKRFIAWIMEQARLENISSEGTERAPSFSDIVVVSHYGSQHDFVALASAIRRSGIRVPGFIVCDSVLLFKLMFGATAPCALGSLKEEFAPEVYLPAHEAEADAEALRAIVMVQPMWMTAVMSTSTPIHAFLTASGFWTSRSRSL